MDSLDYVILVLPVFAVLDVVSTFYVASYGWPIAGFESGFFASYFARMGLIYYYAAMYILFMGGIALFFWFVKNRFLKPSNLADKGVFLLLVLATAYVYIELATAFLGNFFLPHIIPRGISLDSLRGVLYFGSALSLVFFLYGDVSAWLRGTPRK